MKNLNFFKNFLTFHRKDKNKKSIKRSGSVHFRRDLDSLGEYLKI